jgi:hypothetical protein
VRGHLVSLEKGAAGCCCRPGRSRSQEEGGLHQNHSEDCEAGPRHCGGDGAGARLGLPVLTEAFRCRRCLDQPGWVLVKPAAQLGWVWLVDARCHSEKGAAGRCFYRLGQPHGEDCNGAGDSREDPGERHCGRPQSEAVQGHGLGAAVGAGPSLQRGGAVPFPQQ